MELTHDLVLGSQSPRRAAFLTSLGLDFKTLPLDIDESAPAHLSGVEVAAFVSELKAQALSIHLEPGQLGITSDTEVWQNGQRFGKPTDEARAREMLVALSGTTHEVISGLTLVTTDNGIPKLTTETSVVTVSFSEIPDWAIDFYIKQFKPFDKAGAYGIQEWIGAGFIDRIEGNYNSVVGLDTAALFKLLLPYRK
ncbi:MAG: Maf family nucleotide pyrophosphatase [Schleiferiaceae bacterium]|jgi:septum formation protein|nr:Maf family nucleotide pyrophosphatase [Schleiferiaceae bacterium]MDP4758703.1 Maf family nucleotide pyrophosphatase [Schleiferiaceae bacterium]MDP4767845.1 Maf family nucleotide pyrophosphatase [Schleiferiaceae bacterium]